MTPHIEGLQTLREGTITPSVRTRRISTGLPLFETSNTGSRHSNTSEQADSARFGLGVSPLRVKAYTSNHRASLEQENDSQPNSPLGAKVVSIQGNQGVLVTSWAEALGLSRSSHDCSSCNLADNGYMIDRRGGYRCEEDVRASDCSASKGC